jgi:hypothetical protein
MDTGFGSGARDELFRAIERYDIKKLLKASSNSGLGVISEEELQELLKQKNKQRIREEFKRMILENGRLKNFAAFILGYNDPVQMAVLAVLQNESSFNVDTKLPLPANACLTLRNRDLKGCTANPVDNVELADDKNNCSQASSWSSSNSRTPPSPMEVDTKVRNAYYDNLKFLHFFDLYSCMLDTVCKLGLGMLDTVCKLGLGSALCINLKIQTHFNLAASL